MSLRLTQPFIALEKIEAVVQVEPALLLLGLSAIGYLIFKLIKPALNLDRQQRLTGEFRNLTFQLALGACFFSLYFSLARFENEYESISRILPYVGFLALISGLTVFVKICRIFAFEYLFLANLKAAFPLLIVNLLTLFLSLLAMGWIATEVFGVRLAPILATSAIVSLVLGLAVQDTLGNLFSGVAMQFDKPYEIGDWIEIESENGKWIGEVREISWRATVMRGFSNETLIVPNKMVGQSEVSNFSTKIAPVYRSQLFKVPHGYPVEKVRKVLAESILECSEVLAEPAPFTLVHEVTESWITYKLVYMIRQFGRQFLHTDAVLTRGLAALEKAGIPIATSRMLVLKPEAESPAKKKAA